MITIRVSRWKSNATNWPGVIIIRRDVECFAAVWAQEAYETDWKLSLRNLWGYVFNKQVQQEVELMGHEVEVQVASLFYNKHTRYYRAKEARALARYPQFEGVSPQVIVAQMCERTDAAKDWVQRNEKRIRKFYTPPPDERDPINGSND